MAMRAREGLPQEHDTPSRASRTKGDRYNHLDAAMHIRIDWSKLTLDASSQPDAGGDRERKTSASK